MYKKKKKKKKKKKNTQQVTKVVSHYKSGEKSTKRIHSPAVDFVLVQYLWCKSVKVCVMGENTLPHLAVLA